MILTIIAASHKAAQLERSWDRVAGAFASLYPQHMHEFLKARGLCSSYREQRMRFEEGYRKRIQKLERELAERN